MRQKIVFYFALICLFSAFQCDDDYKPDNVVENFGQVEIGDNKTMFSVGDYLFIETSINNQQKTTAGKTINIKDYMFADESTLFFDLEIGKIGLDGEETPYFVTNTQENEGTIFIQDQRTFFTIVSPYNETKTSFTSKIGIQLTEKGTFALKTSRINERAYIIGFDLQSSLGTLQLTTNIANSNDEGIYQFTVE